MYTYGNICKCQCVGVYKFLQKYFYFLHSAFPQMKIWLNKHQTQLIFLICTNFAYANSAKKYHLIFVKIVDKVLQSDYVLDSTCGQGKVKHHLLYLWSKRLQHFNNSMQLHSILWKKWPEQSPFQLHKSWQTGSSEVVNYIIEVNGRSNFIYKSCTADIAVNIAQDFWMSVISYK